MIIRLAESGDEDSVAEIHVRSWQVGYRGLLPDDYLDGLDPAERASRYTFAAADPDAPTTIVATENGVILGFATTAPASDPDVPASGELCALYVHPDFWGRGVGRALIAEARGRLAGQGFAVALLWVLAGNERAGRFYRADGWQHDGTRRHTEVWRLTVPELRYRRELP